MQPTQSAAQVCLFVFLLRMISAALPCQCQKQNISQFFAGRDLSAPAYISGQLFFLLADRFQARALSVSG